MADTDRGIIPMMIQGNWTGTDIPVEAHKDFQEIIEVRKLQSFADIMKTLMLLKYSGLERGREIHKSDYENVRLEDRNYAETDSALLENSIGIHLPRRQESARSQAPDQSCPH